MHIPDTSIEYRRDRPWSTQLGKLIMMVPSKSNGVAIPYCLAHANITNVHARAVRRVVEILKTRLHSNRRVGKGTDAMELAQSARQHWRSLRCRPPPVGQ